MGRKRWWRGGLELLVLCILHHAILGDGDVGCLFSENLCNPKMESCYDDLAFGRCVPLYGDLRDEVFYEYDLNAEDLELLKLRLEKLESGGYKWTHPYTQCVMQAALYNFRHRQNYDFHLCQHLANFNPLGEKNEITNQNGIPTISIINLNENRLRNDAIDGVYYVPEVQNEYDKVYEKEYYRPLYAIESGESGRRTYTSERDKSPYDEYVALRNDEEDFDDRQETSPRESSNLENIEMRLSRARRQQYHLEDYRDEPKEPVRDSVENEGYADGLFLDEDAVMLGELSDGGLEFLVDKISPGDYTLRKEANRKNGGYERTFSRKYKYPRRLAIEFLENVDPRGESVKRNSKAARQESVDYEMEDNENADNDDDDAEVETDALSKQSGIYTEGGLVQSPRRRPELENRDDSYSSLPDDDIDTLLWRRELAGFKRRERLDVKKPGPPFSTNNYAFKAQSSPSILNEKRPEQNEVNEVLLAPVKKEVNSNLPEPKDTARIYKNVDLDHVYMEFQQAFHTWSEGEHVVKEVGKLLELPPGTLKDIRVGRAEVTFKVVQNNRNYNATDVVNNIDNIRGKLRDTLGVEVIRAGIGDKAKLPATLEVSREPEMSSSLFGAMVAAGVAAACAAAVVTLIIARRHAKSRAKLAGLATPDPEASKDYQDLCRARMQAKQPSDKLESPRITSLSRESESNNLPSNRTSTSSCIDEPAISNMDISTGHMVLSYMEDHLKNKDRLDQEWTALCAYDADPSSTEIAENELNVKYNRPGATLPYDHSRVVLNDLANANNSDYINASTITDHDPRNPAYIATQGPLPQTTADFWQMVWEQGSVVIVMLTRLTEEGLAMCHLYWPEEGSELYHIYEVHLVSEHFWCDDYLVRSFYLRNLRTGETRTVTQFHFLSWPENDVPQSTKALLEFRRKVSKSYRGRSCPIVVHCSDGAGRTGTYCLIDMVLNRMMKGAKEIDIAATLEHIRDQRPDMVATKQQFEFVLMAVAEEVHAILKALPVPPSEKTPTSTTSTPPPKSTQ
ncbi:hypothetical protein KM043_016002 [Ampulex compressa]|nr:hypothetical protein KM043_016002 [Ampulex compressa]